LPNLDEKGNFDQSSIAQPGLGKGVANFYAMNYVNAGQGINNLALLQYPVKTFLCPSDTQRGHIGNQLLDGNSMAYATTNYKACAGSNWNVSYDANGVLGGPVVALKGRGTGCKDGLDHGNGVICRGGGTAVTGAPVPTTNSELRDGASKTFLAGECVPEYCGWSLWFWFDGSTATCGIPLNLRLPNIAPKDNSNSWQACYGFASRHPSGANFVACDGSGHYISNQIDVQVYQALATIDGQESVTANGNPVDWP
jgi:prepilin-type processing-associated H-X9-DG protein